MSTHEQFVALRAAIRLASAARRGDRTAAGQLRSAATLAAAAGVSTRLLLPVVSTLRRDAGGDAGSPARRDERARVAAANAAVLTELGRRVDAVSQDGGEAFLLGDAALLALLHHDLGAFPLRLAVAAAPGAQAPEAVELHLRLLGGEPTAAAVGLLEEPLRRKPRRWTHDGRTWRLPSPELALTLLAARLGDPLADPDPSLWHHLAIAFGAWRGRVDVRRMSALAEQVGVIAALNRGLALLGHLLPELAGDFADARRRLSFAERTLAVPIAARKVVAMSLALPPIASTVPVPALQAS